MDEVEACLKLLVIQDKKDGFGENDLIEVDHVYATNYVFMKVGNIKEEKRSHPIIQSLIEQEKTDYKPRRRRSVSQSITGKPFEYRKQISISQPLLNDDTPVYSEEDAALKEEALKEIKMSLDMLNITMNEILNPKWHSDFLMLNTSGILDERDIKAFLFDYLTRIAK